MTADVYLHVSWGLHLILERQYDTNSLKGVDGGAEVERELAPGCKYLPLPGEGKVLQKVVEDDAKTHKLQQVCQHADRGEVPVYCT